MLIPIGMCTKLNVLLCFAIYTCNLRTIRSRALILLQSNALGIWNSLMQKSEFPKMHHYVRFLQIGSPIAVAIVIEYHASYVTSSGKVLVCVQHVHAMA